MSKDSNYSVKEDINYNLPAGPGGDSLGPLVSNSNGWHNGRNLSLDNPDDPFACDSVDVEDNDELCMWSNIASREFLSNVNVCPTTSTTIIPNVLVTLEPNVHENCVVEPNVDEVVEEYGNQMDVDEVQPLASHIYIAR